MISDTLHNVTCHFRIEIAKRQLHQLGEEIGNQCNVYPRIHVQQYPTTNKLYRKTGNKNNQLGNQYQCNKPQVPVTDTYVNQRLGKKRKNKL